MKQLINKNTLSPLTQGIFACGIMEWSDFVGPISQSQVSLLQILYLFTVFLFTPEESEI